ncbi:MAG: hypothetical protein AAF289_06795 [Cyanobacteria bacterium P01_A01_bin.135]
MNLRERWRPILISVCLGLVLIVVACSQIKSPSPYDQVQEETTGRGAQVAVDKTAENGSKFNQFFPKQVSGYNIVPSQEKRGFAEYKVNQDGSTVAMLSINDTISNPSAADKYQSSSFDVAGYPAVDQGSKGTGLLVNGRYQVKVLTRDDAFTRDDRLAWLQKFDLKGLSRLEAQQSSAAPALGNKAPRLPRALSPQPAT